MRLVLMGLLVLLGPGTTQAGEMTSRFVYLRDVDAKIV
jgi:hypothetical protein